MSALQFLDERLPSRFWSKVIPEPNSGCWLWLGGGDIYGYGRIAILRDGQRRTRSSHRFAFEALVGVVPNGLVLDHLCRTPACVNPAHLEAVTQAVNVRRGDAGCHQRAKTHCPSGHEYTDANVYWSLHTNGRRFRRCRECLIAAGTLSRHSRVLSKRAA
jgi:hypothetical protein